jgi:uncharacterized protein YecE (DUF72 family)
VFLSTSSVYGGSKTGRGGYEDAAMKALVGTSGWQYRHWKDTFYEGVPRRAWLGHYATRFPVVEVNNTFYALPKETTFDKWKAETPEGFLFVLKASRYLTHIGRLQEPKGPVDLFWQRAVRLRSKLGPVLFQFPPNFPADVPLLEDFLAVLPAGMRSAFEFRESSWWQDEVFDAIDRAGAAWVMADRPGWRVPLVVTGGWSYVRFHQGRPAHPGYTRRKLSEWADRIAGLDASEAWVFFNNDQFGAAPVDAVALEELLAERGVEVAEPPSA